MDNTKHILQCLLNDKISKLQQEIKETFDLLCECEFEPVNDIFAEELTDKEWFIRVITCRLNTRK